MDVKKVAKLAHLDISEEEVEMYAPQMNEIVAYVEQLNELDTETTEPAIGGLTPEGEATKADRNDGVRESLSQDEALDQAPSAVEGHFRVPKVL
ncbi:MAG: Asp-tRNA(Asn)/Glu-tRNA(Gln) amidotransferase subunit GatC [Acidobacteria bacterium]|nr:MAG: Asp-tRNA(Asn)/Glu-tRNA(Gln) amidotransferase subunit GatC [Acidobacteriota bacterium]REK02598.1 MAG: Asp-tRNA(Asn)/Glu-tRNA(Gln) amidotransferase subunit GatC [Acidobacteriota bacterium]REK13599.1 MAG: Asp-tRNA(Asn)/Glu-tRNA(Gln) amidotransferase subunit GatC [Acidobacteriota bacterium]REK41593.1 MAG: Asp-tRNA(Asn)/Glu-tRNA(Gln) amidotransferase subunit GatC [Acidobacteriota bacterium]